ncbi:hypothetical protein E3T61_09895 [Cryobacterium lactosi]|uniref:Uncharacterized protein n=1 Tax=Cryobacterium lactosi TaxID=1259202 RepID=A0A4R9BTS0_9MICO|nr:hypothetical protein [Cryobacterium lactosi]TFD90815.1 hypothetical protein E3T61_09895 [Cryobacterium lactosi]
MMHALNEPSHVIDFVASLLTLDWPVSEEEAVAFLKRLDCDVLVSHQAKERVVRVGRWRYPALNLWGTWTSDPVCGTRLRFFMTHPTPTEPTLMLRYHSLIDEISHRFGAPEVIDRNPISPHAQWCRDNLTLSVDAYTRLPRPPRIQLTIQPARIFISSRAVSTPPEFTLGA